MFMIMSQTITLDLKHGLNVTVFTHNQDWNKCEPGTKNILEDAFDN